MIRLKLARSHDPVRRKIAMDPSIEIPQPVLYQQGPAGAAAIAAPAHRGYVAPGLALITLLLLLDVALVLVRRHFGHMQNYHFIPWNLFLACVPYGVSLGVALLQRCWPRRRWLRPLAVVALLPLYALWLLFLPNAPYLLTDVAHVENQTPLQLWYDSLMLGIYAVTGYALAIASLAIMQRPVRALLGWRGGWLFALVCCFLAGVGVHLGRAERYNSWDVLGQSRAVLADVADRLVHPYDHPHTMFDALSYAALLLLGYVAYLTLSSKDARALLLTR